MTRERGKLPKTQPDAAVVEMLAARVGRQLEEQLPENHPAKLTEQTVHGLLEKPEPFSLELAQRDLLNLLDEEMDFSERSLANALREIANSEELQIPEIDRGAYNFLKALADALDNDRAEWSLALARSKKGPFKSPSDAARQHSRDAWTQAMVMHLVDGGMKTEAAVAEVAGQQGWSRASIFKSIKRMRELDSFAEQQLGITGLARKRMENFRQSLGISDKG